MRSLETINGWRVAPIAFNGPTPQRIARLHCRRSGVSQTGSIYSWKDGRNARRGRNGPLVLLGFAAARWTRAGVRGFRSYGERPFSPGRQPARAGGALTWRVRLVGTEIVRRSGDLKGRNYIDLLVPDQREREDRRLATMVTHPCGSHAIRENRRPSAVGYFVRTVALPLWSKDGQRRFVIATNEEINRDRLGVETGLNEIRIERVFLNIGAGLPIGVE
jgi:hypothetical protein